MPVRPELGVMQVTAFSNKGIRFLSEWRRNQYLAVWDHNVLGRAIQRKHWTSWTGLTSSSRDAFVGILCREL